MLLRYREFSRLGINVKLKFGGEMKFNAWMPATNSWSLVGDPEDPGTLVYNPAGRHHPVRGSPIVLGTLVSTPATSR